MSLTRREFLSLLAAAGTASVGLPRMANGAVRPDSLYDIPPFGNVSLLHITDCHAQLTPTYFREPSINIGLGEAAGRPPHIVGDAFLKYFRYAPKGREAYAFTYLNFETAARKYGKVGGFAHLATLVKQLRDSRPGRTLLLDGGDTWQGSATALWTNGQDMIDATKLLGVDVMTGHWEFTYGADRVKQVVENDLAGKMDFVAQNVSDNAFGDLIFKPYVIREINNVPVAIIGQAFPYTPIANPRHLIPDWTFGIQEEQLQRLVEEAREKGAQVVVLLSHGGMDADFKLAGRVTGIDIILGGHTHDALPEPHVVENRSGKTWVIHSGCNGKFLSLVDLDVRNGRIEDIRYRLLPIFSNLLPADPAMAAHIQKVRAPFLKRLNEKLAVTESTLYRRGNFSGTFDQLIVDALRAVKGTDISFSPGFRWGTSLLPGDIITMERLMDQTAITYPTVLTIERKGSEIKEILEDVADNLFNKDAYLQQGGDMVRVGGMRYAISPDEPMGRRIGHMETVDGRTIEAGKTYKIATWGSVQPHEPGVPVWDVVAEYLRGRRSVVMSHADLPKISGLEDNPGIASRASSAVGTS